jgi:two-component response regulator (ARR-A family)
MKGRCKEEEEEEEEEEEDQPNNKRKGMEEIVNSPDRTRTRYNDGLEVV